MWNRMLGEAVAIAVQTVILIGLCATIGISLDQAPQSKLHVSQTYGVTTTWAISSAG